MKALYHITANKLRPGEEFLISTRCTLYKYEGRDQQGQRVRNTKTGQRIHLNPLVPVNLIIQNDRQLQSVLRR